MSNRPGSLQGSSIGPKPHVVGNSPDVIRDNRVRVAGINVEGGKLYLAAVTPSSTAKVLAAPIFSGARRLELNTGLDEARG